MSEKIQVTCRDCEKRLAVPASAAGKRIRCPGCGGEVRVPSGSASSPQKKKKPRPRKRSAETFADDYGDDPYSASPSSGLPPRVRKKKSKGKTGSSSSASGRFSGAKKFQLGVSMFFGSMVVSAGRMAVLGNKTPVTNEEKGAAFGAALVIFVGVVAGLVLMLWGSIQHRREKND